MTSANQNGQTESRPAGTQGAGSRLIVRLDDMGFCHAANMAVKRILEEGVCTSVSVIVNTPWLDEAVAILREHPEVSVGVHLTINSEWREYRWGPVRPYTEVPSLVDEFGHFFGSRKELMAHNPKVEEVARELRAQIDLALRKGLKVSYCDYHMGAAVSTPEFQAALEKLAAEYRIGISRYFGETDTPSVYAVPPEGKREAGIRIIEGLTTPGLHLFVCHPGLDTPEMAVMTDLNVTGLKNMAAHRQAETDLLCDPAFRRAIERGGLELVGYAALRAEGLERMTRPGSTGPYGPAVPESRVSDK
jgi:predicted glycoside hydrolase/deacetylase ChbG (UPF0249 family)